MIKTANIEMEIVGLCVGKINTGPPFLGGPVFVKIISNPTRDVQGLQR